jgi:hypothetical protein
MAGIIFHELKDFSKDAPKRVIIPGRSFERFLLKILFGLLSTNQFEHQGRKYSTNDLNDEWVKVLFGLAEFPTGTGLFVHYQPGARIEISNRLTVAPVFMDSMIAGLQIEIGGFRFLLSLFPKEQAFKRKHPAFNWIMYHPNTFNKEPFPQEIRFDWS